MGYLMYALSLSQIVFLAVTEKSNVSKKEIQAEDEEV